MIGSFTRAGMERFLIGLRAAHQPVDPGYWPSKLEPVYRRIVNDHGIPTGLEATGVYKVKPDSVVVVMTDRHGIRIMWPDHPAESVPDYAAAIAKVEAAGRWPTFWTILRDELYVRVA